MAVNVYRPHIYVIPEDDADRQFADGFELDGRLIPLAMQVMPIAGGWLKVIDKILEDYVPRVRNNPNTHIVGIIDCDGRPDRISTQLARMPADVRDRVFLLGTLDDPQAFKNLVRLTYEKIGIKLADECYRRNFSLWRHEQLAHIHEEISRAAVALRPVLFV